MLDLVKSKHLTGSPKNQVTVVFDGYPDETIDYGRLGLEVIFSKSDTADEKIRKIIQKSQNPRIAVVVSDDKEIVLFIRACGARPMAVVEFLSQVDRVKGTNVEQVETELSYSQRHKINEELKKIWLK